MGPLTPTLSIPNQGSSLLLSPIHIPEPTILRRIS